VPEPAFKLAKPVLKGVAKLGADPFAADDGELSSEMARVRDWITDTYRVSETAIEPALVAAEAHAEELGFDPLLIVAIMAVESSFNPRAVSNMGAQGLMQVIPKYHKDKIGPNGGRNALFDPQVNVRVGTLVLHEGLQRYGSMQRALQYYNGALKDPKARYTRKVMALKKRLMMIAGRTDTRTSVELAG
jgi:soluble lytic murein transglycosylase-like protein